MIRHGNNVYTTNTQDDGFSVTVACILIDMGAELYVPLFKKYNFGKKDIEQLINEDLIIMGVDDIVIRQKILKLFDTKNKKPIQRSTKLTQADMLTVNRESKKVIELTSISLNNCIQNLSLAQNPEDVLVKPNVYATDLMLEVIDEVEIQLKGICNRINNEKKGFSNTTMLKKIGLISLGGTLIAIIGGCLIKYVKIKA